MKQQMENEFNEWECPFCGWSTENDDLCENMVACTPLVPNVAVSMNTGPWNARDWIETWKCPECLQIFEVENSNY